MHMHCMQVVSDFSPYMITGSLQRCKLPEIPEKKENYLRLSLLMSNFAALLLTDIAVRTWDFLLITPPSGFCSARWLNPDSVFTARNSDASLHWSSALLLKKWMELSFFFSFFFFFF